MPSSFTEKNYPQEVILSEANGHQSRETVTVISGAGVCVAGQVLGKITASGKYQPVDGAASDGSQTATVVLLEEVDATSADRPALVLARNAEVKSALLAYKSGQSAPQKATQLTNLAAVGIIAR